MAKLKLKRLFLAISVFTIVITLAAFLFLNFIYLPQKVKAQGPAFLKQKSQGRVQAQSIEYIPLKGILLRNATLLSKENKPLFTLDKLSLNVALLPLFTRRILDFRLDIYPQSSSKPVVLNGLYQIHEQLLKVDSKIDTDLFAAKQTIAISLKALIDKREIELELASRDLNARAKFYIEGEDLRIEQLSGKAVNSTFELFGDIQNLAQPLLNIYGDLNIDLSGLKEINPKYSGKISQLDISGNCLGKVYLSSALNNPEMGLKINSPGVRINRIEIEDLSIIAQLKDKQVDLSKFYARLCDGEFNLEGFCRLDEPGAPANFNINVFNMDLNKISQGLSQEAMPVHGRVFSLGRLNAPLKNIKDVSGKVWLNASGTNILEFPLLKGIAEVLNLPQLRNLEFKEASGNFYFGQQQVKTEDFKITGEALNIYFKGYVDFLGNLAFDVQPNFSSNFFSDSSNIRNILGAFVDSTGNYLGEIKMKGTIQEPRFTYKPLVMEKLLQRGISEGLKQLFKFRNEEGQDQ